MLTSPCKPITYRWDRSGLSRLWRPLPLQTHRWRSWWGRQGLLWWRCHWIRSWRQQWWWLSGSAPEGAVDGSIAPWVVLKPDTLHLTATKFTPCSPSQPVQIDLPFSLTTFIPEFFPHETTNLTYCSIDTKYTKWNKEMEIKSNKKDNESHYNFVTEKNDQVSQPPITRVKISAHRFVTPLQRPGLAFKYDQQNSEHTWFCCLQFLLCCCNGPAKV